MWKTHHVIDHFSEETCPNHGFSISFCMLTPISSSFRGSRYISGPDANTRPEDVPPPALCVPILAALRRPRPWQKSAPQVIFVGRSVRHGAAPLGPLGPLGPWPWPWWMWSQGKWRDASDQQATILATQQIFGVSLWFSVLVRLGLGETNPNGTRKKRNIAYGFVWI